MSRDVCSCRFTDSVATTLRILQQNQLHRLPVLDQHDRLVGILSLADAARAAARQPGGGGVTEGKLVEVLESIAAPRATMEIAAAP
jgi:CBS-domain-containing membrane protein